MIKDFSPRLYQQAIFAEVSKYNSLVVLPTGLGKTGIAMMMAVHRLQLYPDSKILFLAPTKPLVEQHEKTLKRHLPDKNIISVSGSISPTKRAKLWEDNQIIISTPQGIQNDVISNKISLKTVSLLIFDEAHRGTGDYSYVYLAHKYVKEAIKERILALTASPGSDEQVISDVINNLHIENIEIRTENDPDVKQYIQEKEINWMEVKLPEDFDNLLKNLRTIVKNKLKEIAQLGYFDPNIKNYSKKTLLKLTAELQARMASGEKEIEILKSLSLVAEAMKAEHALELAETQGVSSLHSYFKEIQSQAQRKASKAVQNLINDSYFKAASYLTEELKEKNIEHPKLNRLIQLVKKEENKIIIFNQFRDQAIKIKEALDNEGITSELFFGQAKKKGKGLSQKEQKAMIENFEIGKFQVLIATSVAEEGLDIPAVDKVIFYEPIPSAIRTVQRRGRTGRHSKGSVIVLVAKNTRDEAYRWSAHHKENRMFRVIQQYKMTHKLRNEKSLTSYIKKSVSDIMDEPQEEQNELLIIIDHRERHSAIVKELSKQGINIELHKLDIGDYLLSENVVVEYKTQSDFVNSIIDGRLLEQAINLRKYSKPLIIIEGTEDLFSQRNIHPNAIRGMLSSLTLQFKIPILYTKNPIDTAGLLLVIAKQEQEKAPKSETLHSIKPKTDRELQEYIVASLPGIGTSLAKPLLEEFKTVKKLFMASQERLEKVPLIGKKKAERIRNILDKDY